MRRMIMPLRYVSSLAAPYALTRRHIADSERPGSSTGRVRRRADRPVMAPILAVLLAPLLQAEPG